jgi:type II secretory pathway pseudopilin PulG
MNKENLTNNFNNKLNMFENIPLDPSEHNNSTKVSINEAYFRKLNALKNGGFAMSTELLVVIGIVIGILVFVFGVLGPMRSSSNLNTLLGELTSFQSDIRSVYSGQQDGYTGISAAEVIKSKAYPGSLNATSTTLTSSSAGKVTITSDDGGGTTFSIQYDSVPTGVCNKIVSKLASAGGWNEVDVGGSAVWKGTDATPKKTVIDSACGAKANVIMKFISN